MQFGLDTEQTENEILQPIAPDNMLPDPNPLVSEIQSDEIEILGDQEQNVLEEEDKCDEASEQPLGTKVEQRKGKLVVQSFQLARNHKPTHKFGCVGCSSKFANNKELNDHFRTSHPPLACSDCKKLFPTPSAFEKHKYKHYEFMYECDRCNKGFHFESELLAHRRKHCESGTSLFSC